MVVTMKKDNVTQIPYDYPKLSALKDYFSALNKDKKIKYDEVKIFACQHILEPQKVMFEKIIEFGIKPSNIFLLGKIYSTNFEILDELKRIGINAYQPEFDQSLPFDIQHKKNCEKIFSKSENDDQIIIIDDGAQLLEIFNKTKHDNVVGVEQTSSGFRKLEKIALNFPVFNVARSRVKLEQETPLIVSLGQKRIKEKILEWKLEKPNILIVGLGPVGKEMTETLKNEGDVFKYDISEGEKNIIDLILKNKVDIVIGATGSRILSHDEIVKINHLLNKKIYLVSMSSSDREFEIWKLRDIFIKTSSVHTDIFYGNITIANNGFPITFKGNRFESTPKEIEKTICLLFASVILGIIEKNNLANGLINIPEKIEKLI